MGELLMLARRDMRGQLLRLHEKQLRSFDERVGRVIFLLLLLTLLRDLRRFMRAFSDRAADPS